MLSLAAIWPPYAVRLVEGDLTMTVITDDDVPGLVDLALSGVHEADRMPFAHPWTDADPADLPANMARFYASIRADFTPERFSLEFAVRLGGELVGVQGFTATDFVVTRTGETGSWLAERYQGRGIGTRMRRAVCTLAFDGLGAVEVTSSAFADNPSSLAVSRKLGYRPNGTTRLARRGQPAVNHRLVLTPETFVRGASLDMTGVPGLRGFLGLD